MTRDDLFDTLLHEQNRRIHGTFHPTTKVPSTLLEDEPISRGETKVAERYRRNSDSRLLQYCTFQRKSTTGREMTDRIEFNTINERDQRKENSRHGFRHKTSFATTFGNLRSHIIKTIFGKKKRSNENAKAQQEKNLTSFSRSTRINK